MKIDIDVEYNESIRPNDIEDMVADIASIEKIYTWKPKIDIKTGVRLTIGEFMEKYAK